MAQNYIVADVGGTHIRVASFPTQSQTPSMVKKIPTHGPDSPHERLINLIATVAPRDDEIAAITVAAPGPLDPYEGIIFEAPNIPSWCNLPLRKLIQDRFSVPVEIGNDANLAALAEWRFGAGKGHHHLVYITVSTGIGGGVIIDDRLLLGVRGLASELGHITVLAGGPLCGCGGRGHVESLSSGPAISRWVEQELSEGVPSSLSNCKPVTAREVSLAAGYGDMLALDALARAGTYLGIAIAGYLHAFNPSVVIIGGGVSQSGEPLFGPLRKAMHENVMSAKYVEDLTLTTCTLGDEVGLMGALALAQTLDKPDPCR